MLSRVGIDSDRCSGLRSSRWRGSTIYPVPVGVRVEFCASSAGVFVNTGTDQSFCESSFDSSWESAMPQTYLPARESEMLNWTLTFGQTLLERFEEFGVPGQMAQQYWATQQRFTQAMSLATNPNTRTIPIVGQKNLCKRELTVATTRVVEVIQAWPGMTNTKREELGITVRDRTARVVPVPTEKPSVTVVEVDGHWATIGFGSKPTGVSGVSIFVQYDQSGSTDVPRGAWEFVAMSGRTRVRLPFYKTLDACTVWVSAMWFNGRKQCGPSSTPVSIRLAATEPLVAGEMGTTRAAA
jgi:hypothetical protein